MLDPRKPYVKVTVNNKTGSVYGDDEECPPNIAIKMRLAEEGGETYLRYLDVGAGRGHTQPGKVIEELQNGIVFHMTRMDWTCTFTELTMEQFEKRMRPRLRPAVSNMIHDLDDVYVWIRQKCGMT